MSSQSSQSSHSIQPGQSTDAHLLAVSNTAGEPASGPDDGILATGGLICTVTQNPFQHPEAVGRDAFMASMPELPGLVAFGSSEEEASRLWRSLAVRELETASQERRQRLDAARASVQFNHRIGIDQKAQIARRASEAGTSVRQFMLNQCLLAPIWKPPTTMPPDQREQHWRAVAKTASDRKSADPANLEGSA